MQLGARRVGRAPGAPVGKVRVAQELQREEGPGERAVALLPYMQADRDEAIRKRAGAHGVVGAHQLRALDHWSSP